MFGTGQGVGSCTTQKETKKDDRSLPSSFLFTEILGRYNNAIWGPGRFMPKRSISRRAKCALDSKKP